MAALTASEASIYGRFGFGVATSEQSIKVDTRARFRLNHTPVGSVEVAEPKVLLDLAPEVFDRLHRHDARIRRPARVLPAVRLGIRQPRRGRGPEGQGGAALRRPAATWTATSPTSSPAGPAPRTPWRSWTWWRRPEPRTWNCGSTWQPSTWWTGSAGRKRRWTIRCRGRSRTRAAWRLRKPGTCSGCGSWTCSRPWGPAATRPTGGWCSRVSRQPRLRRPAPSPWTVTAAGEATVTPASGTDAAPDLTLDVADLGSIYLGAVCPVTLAAAGRITEHAPGAALTARLDVRRRTSAALPDAFLGASAVRGLHGPVRFDRRCVND